MTRLSCVMSTFFVVLAIVGSSFVPITPKLIWNASASAPIGLYVVRTIAHLHAKSGSLARVSDFAFDIRRIAARQRLPGYSLLIEHDGRTELLRIMPIDSSTVPVNNTVNRLGRSGANGIGRSGAALFIESNRESNSSLSLSRALASNGAGASRRRAP